MAPVYLTLTSTAPDATDLGFLLHKHPDRAQAFELSVGHGACVLPGGDRRAVHGGAAARGRPGRAGPRRGGTAATRFALGQYVNDRPYAASSLLAVALGKVFRTAMTGRCDARPELAGRPLPLEIARARRCPAAAAPELVARLFEPLGWTVEAAPVPLDETFPEWGDSPLRRPAADRRRCGWPTRCTTSTCCCRCSTTPSTTGSAADEVDKLVRAGEGWLAAHPERDLITRRYLAHQRDLVAHGRWRGWPRSTT